jgi:hypothetical protein
MHGYQRDVALSHTNVLEASPGITLETPLDTLLVASIANVTVLIAAASLITVIVCPLNVPACRMMPVTSAPGLTRATPTPAVVIVSPLFNAAALLLVRDRQSGIKSGISLTP